jgi:site-specific recombinase XerD
MQRATILVVRVDDDRYALQRDEQLISDANAFLDTLAVRGLSPRTLRSYAYDLVVLYRWFDLTGRKLTELTSADVVAFIASQREADAAPRSINRRLCTMRLLHRFCTGQDLASGALAPSAHYKGPGRDHALGIHRLRRRATLKLRVKEPQPLIEPLTPQQVRSFIRNLDRYRDLAIAYAMLFCGLRSKEVLDLELGDVVFDDAIIRVRGKGGRERVVPLPDLLAQTLRQYLACERPARCPDPYLFVVLQGRGRGRPMSTAGLRSLFRRRRKLALLRNANAHRFRHTFAADMTRFGVRIPILQRLMGHADLKTTLGYVRLSVADLTEEYRRALVELSRRYGQR